MPAVSTGRVARHGDGTQPVGVLGVQHAPPHDGLVRRFLDLVVVPPGDDPGTQSEGGGATRLHDVPIRGHLGRGHSSVGVERHSEGQLGAAARHGLIGDD